MPEAKAIPQAGDTEQALRLAEQLRQKHPDFYFVYYWLGILWDRRGDREKARQHLLEGMRLSKSKRSLYTQLGDLEWKWGSLPEAVKWWLKSVVVQVGSQHVTDYVAFLHLSYVAEALGIQAACSQLRAWEDRIRTGHIRLTAQAANELYAATRRQATSAMRHAIELLYKHYLST